MARGARPRPRSARGYRRGRRARPQGGRAPSRERRHHDACRNPHEPRRGVAGGRGPCRGRRSALGGDRPPRRERQRAAGTGLPRDARDDCDGDAVTTMATQKRSRRSIWTQAACRRTTRGRGGGRPLVMLHGGFCAIDTFMPLRKAWAQRFRVYLPERRGHGRTPTSRAVQLRRSWPERRDRVHGRGRPRLGARPRLAEHWDVIVDKLWAMYRSEPDLQIGELARVSAPTLLMLGEHDLVTVEHAE